MKDRLNMIQKAADYLRERIGLAEVAVVLGSGLGNYADNLEEAVSVPYAEIPGFPVSTAPGHAGRFWSGRLMGKKVFLLQGRIHAYEGESLFETTMYVRVLKLLGVKTLILTNAAGCVNTNWQPGDLMLLTDHINLSGMNPLIGENLNDFGPRFPDLSEVYSRRLRNTCIEAAEQMHLTLREGVYTWFSGPSYETPAEIRMVRVIGGDAVGMSTVPEAIVAKHCGLEVLAISCLTNMAAGIQTIPLNHQEVLDTAARTANAFSALVNAVIERI